MLFIWGTRSSYKKLGRVADYCVFCDDATGHRVRELRTVAHFYYLPLGRGKVQAWEVRCDKCKQVGYREPNDGPTPTRTRRLDLQELVDTTHPELIPQLERRLERTDRLLAGQLTDRDRWQLLLEPLGAVSEVHAARAAQTQLDVWAGLSILLWLILPVPGLLIADAVAPRSDEAMIVGGLLGFALGFAVTAYLVATDARRFVRRRYRRFLVERLAAIQPSESQLQAVLDQLHKGNPKLPKALPAELLHRWVEDANA